MEETSSTKKTVPPRISLLPRRASARETSLPALTAAICSFVSAGALTERKRTSPALSAMSAPTDERLKISK